MKPKSIVALSFALTISVILPGCGDAPNLADDQVTEKTDPLTVSWSSVRLDYGTVCMENGVAMHCCPPNMFMIGAHITQNILKCAAFSSAVYQKIGALYMDGPDAWRGPTLTVRNGMHACPFGSVMVGLHATRNDLMCAQVDLGYGGRQLQERVDYGTSDSNGIHVCPPATPVRPGNMTYYDGWAMSGIHGDLNRLLCAY